MGQRLRGMNERSKEKKKRMNERNVCEGESERNVIAMQLKKKYVAVENPFYVLIVNEGDVLVAQNVHCRVHSKR